MLKGDSLYNYFKTNLKANIKTYNNLNELIKKSGTRIVVLDSEVYSHYQTSKLKKLRLLYKANMMNDYRFMVKSNNTTFYDLFNYIIIYDDFLCYK